MLKWCFLFLVSFFSFALDAKELEIEKVSYKDLQKIYDFYDYDEYLPLDDYFFPPIFLKNIPEGYEQIVDEPYRNRMFIKILAPLALKVNEDILAERNEIMPLYNSFVVDGNKLNKKQKEFVEQKAEKYDIFSRLQDDERYLYLLKELTQRVDEVPVSVIIAISAVETNWGTNRLVRDGNVLFKERVWHTSEGLKSKDDDDDYRYRIFPSLYDAIYSFALKINSDNDFENFRYMRREIRYRRKPVTGINTAFSLLFLSAIKNFAGLIEYTVAYYELNVIDKCKLDDKMLEKDLDKELARLIR